MTTATRAAEGDEVLVDDEPLPHDPEEALLVLRRNGFVFEGYNLFPHLTALQIIVLPLIEVHGLSSREALFRAMKLLKLLGIVEHHHKRPAELSGCQQQRAAIARALAPRPAMLLLDEPTSALDPVMTGEVLESSASSLKAASRSSWPPTRSASRRSLPTGSSYSQQVV